MYECGPKWGLGTSPKVSPFSPIDCASKISLNEASKFEFEVVANFASFGKMLQQCLKAATPFFTFNLFCTDDL